MTGLLLRRLRARIELPRTLRALLLALTLSLALVAGLTAASCSGFLPTAPPPGVIQPSITPSTAEKGTLTVKREFKFENVKVELSVPIDRSVYAGAVGAQKAAIFTGDERPSDWVPNYYRAFIDEPRQKAFYDSMLEALHKIREQLALDETRYVELITSMAQSLEYRTDPSALAPKFPIETFGNGYGDCDDKTLLAAALLSREGFDVAILLFQPEKHVALGIRATGLNYKHTGYAYVELTEPRLVGVPAMALATGEQLISQPEVIGVGEGMRAYPSGAQITYIERRLHAIASAVKDLQVEIVARQDRLKAEKTSLDAESDSLRSITGPGAQQVAVERYNAHVKTYNTHIAEVNQLIARYNALVEIERYAADNQTGRRQIYARVRAAKV